MPNAIAKTPSLIHASENNKFHQSGNAAAPLCLLQKFARVTHSRPNNQPQRSKVACENSQDISFKGSSPHTIICPRSSPSPALTPLSLMKLWATSEVTLRRRSRREADGSKSIPTIWAFSSWFLVGLKTAGRPSAKLLKADRCRSDEVVIDGSWKRGWNMSKICALALVRS